MKFTNVENIKYLKKGDTVALANKVLEKQTSSNLIFGVVKEIKENTKTSTTSAVIMLNGSDEEVLVDNKVLKLTIFYKVDINDDLSPNYIALTRRLRKAEKLVRRYKATMLKRFNISEEELDRNFDKAPKVKSKKEDDFVVYKTVSDEIPYIREDKTGLLHANVKFSANNKGAIKCEIAAHTSKYSSVTICKSTAIALCHEEDTFNKATGELVAYNKAYADMICKLH